MAGGGAGGTEVGRISIRVVPNLDNFYRELKTKLEAIEKQLRGNVPIDIDLNAKGTRAKMAALMAGLKAQAAQGVDVPVDVNNKGLGAAWREFRAGLADFGRLGKQAAQGVKSYRDEVNRLTLEQQRQRPLLNHTYAWWRSNNIMARRGATILRDFTDALRTQQQWLRQQDRTLTANQARWKSWAMAIRDANVNATNGFRRFRASLQALRGGGGGDDGDGFSRIFGSLGRFGNEAEKAGSQVEHVGKKFLGLTRMGWLVTGVFLAAAPAIALVSGLLAGLPSLIGAFGAGIGAVALGMDGIKAAAEVLMPAFEQMKTAVSSTFQQALVPQFQQLLGLMPMIQTGMQGVAQGMSSMFQGVTDALSKGAGPAQIENLLANTKTFFEQLQPAANQFTQSFLTLASSGSDAFGYLSGSLNTFSTQFNDMVNRVSQNGVMDGAMKGLSQTLDGVTNLFTRLMESGLQAMSQLGGPMNTFLTGIGDLAVALMPALTSLSGLFGNVAGTLGTALAPIVTALTPAFTTLADTLGSLLVPNIQTLGNILTPVATMIGTTLTTALQQIQPMIPGLVESFAQLGSTLVSQLAPHIPALATAMGQMAGAVIKLAPMLISQLVPAFIDLIPSITQLLPHVVSLAESFARMMPTIVPLVSIIFSLIAAFAQAAATIGGVVLGAISSLIGVISEVVAKISEWVSSFAQGVSDIAAKAAELPGMVKSALGDLGSFLVSSGKALVQGFINGIKSMVGAVADAARSVVQAARDFFPFSPAKKGPFSGSGWVDASGQSVGEAFADGLAGTQGKIVETARAIMQAAKDVFGDAANIAFNFNFGQMQSQMASVASSAGDLQRSMSRTVSQSTGSGKIDDETRQMLDQISIRKDELELERQRLQAEKNALDTKDKAGRAALQQRIDELNIQKDQLELQREQLSYQSKYTDSVAQTGAQYDEMFNKLTRMPYDFATANANQFLSDIGISGDGALSQALKEGLKFGEQFIFNVGSMDEAVQGQQTIQNKKSLQFDRR
ncbi:tape measure protein [Mycobacterium phage Heathen]|uniref:Tape measure protein n=3 Tax=Veracruzvirus heldan TaxID=1032892 RepID=A0A516KRN2_9CAUD|nr:tail length tape measure protein [Mycobacterium phage HelDan]AEJ92019.1 tape measure protein [Mycobacterium phage HelDan]ASW31283.1 tape measure protein [Mycobacterium phage Fred313]QDP44305.1 tape measure protein [Mycobacterium phage Heathen]